MSQVHRTLQPAASFILPAARSRVGFVPTAPRSWSAPQDADLPALGTDIHNGAHERSPSNGTLPELRDSRSIATETSGYSRRHTATGEVNVSGNDAAPRSPWRPVVVLNGLQHQLMKTSPTNRTSNPRIRKSGTKDEQRRPIVRFQGQVPPPTSAPAQLEARPQTPFVRHIDLKEASKDEKTSRQAPTSWAVFAQQGAPVPSANIQKLSHQDRAPALVDAVSETYQDTVGTKSRKAPRSASRRGMQLNRHQERGDLSHKTDNTFGANPLQATRMNAKTSPGSLPSKDDEVRQRPGSAPSIETSVRKVPSARPLNLAAPRKPSSNSEQTPSEARRVLSSRTPDASTELLKDLVSEKVPIGKQDDKPQLSLMDELFPELSTRQTDANTGPEKVVELPKLAFEDEDPIVPPSRLRSVQRRATIEAFESRGAEMTVLRISNASPNLTEDDFRRLVPRGKHIKEWNVPGDFIKVIPKRDPETFERQETYFMLFSSPAAARAYQEHLIRLHYLARTHSPTSLTSPIPAPPGTLVDGEDTHHLRQIYAIFDPALDIKGGNVRILTNIYKKEIQQLIAQQGYDLLVQGQDQKSGKGRVMLTLEHVPLTPRLLWERIMEDGHARGLYWSLAGDEKAITRVEGSLFSFSKQEENDDDKDEDEAIERARAANKTPKWLIDFTDRDEAKRFTRAWDRRPLPGVSITDLAGEDPSLVRTEMLW